MDAFNAKRFAQRQELLQDPSPAHDNSSPNQVSIDNWLGMPVADGSSAILALRGFLDLFGPDPTMSQAKPMETAAGQPESQDEQAQKKANALSQVAKIIGLESEELETLSALVAHKSYLPPPPQDPLAKYKAYLRETVQINRQPESPLCPKAQSQPMKADPKVLAQVQPNPDVPTLAEPMAQPTSQTTPEDAYAIYKAYLRKTFKMNRPSESMFSAPIQSEFEPLEAQPNPETQDTRPTDIQQSLEKKKLEHEETRSQLHQAQIDLQDIQIQSSNPLEIQLQAIQKDLEDLKLQNNQKFEKLEEKIQESGCRKIHEFLEKKETEMDVIQDCLDQEKKDKEELEAQVKELQKSLDEERQSNLALLTTIGLERGSKAALEAQVQALQNSLRVESENYKADIQELQECLDEEKEDHEQSKVCLQKCLEDIRVLNKIIDAKDYDFSVKIKNLQKTLDSESDVRKEMEEDMEDLKMIIATMNLDFDSERGMTSLEIQNYQMTIEDVRQELETLKEERAQLDDDVTAKSDEIVELNKKLADFEVDMHHMNLLLQKRDDEKKALSDDVTQKTARIQELIRMIKTRAIGF